MKEKKENLLLALVLSSLVCLAGSVVWGLIYYAGYFASYIALAEVIVAGIVYSKFKKINWLGILWISAFTIIFNELSMVVADILIIVKEFDCSISVAIDTLKLLFEDSEFSSAFTSDSFSNILFTFIGIVFYVVTYLKNKKLAKSNAESIINFQPTTQQPEVQATTVQPNSIENKVDETNKEIEKVDINELYSKLISKINILTADYQATQNKDTFKTELKNLKDMYISPLNEEDTTALKNLIETKLTQETIDTETKKQLTFLQNLIK